MLRKKTSYGIIPVTEERVVGQFEPWWRSSTSGWDADSLCRMQIRPAVPSDVSELTRLRIAAIAEANPTACIPESLVRATSSRLAELLARPDGLICWVADAGNELVAMAAVAPFDRLPTLANPSGRDGYVTSVYTVPPHRRGGHATALMRALVKDAEA